MAEVELQHELEPEVLNGDVDNEEREDAEPSESAKKKRRKKKKNKAPGPGEIHDCMAANNLENSAILYPAVLS